MTAVKVFCSAEGFFSRSQLVKGIEPRQITVRKEPCSGHCLTSQTVSPSCSRRAGIRLRQTGQRLAVVDSNCAELTVCTGSGSGQAGVDIVVTEDLHNHFPGADHDIAADLRFLATMKGDDIIAASAAPGVGGCRKPVHKLRQ